MLLSLQNIQINAFLKLEGERDMENRDNVKEKEDKTLAMEMLGELKEQSKRWFRAFLVMVAVEVLTIGGFIWYLNQYDFISTVEQTGIYTLSDSQGNVISSDITPDQVKEIMEILNDGKDTDNEKQN